MAAFVSLFRRRASGALLNPAEQRKLATLDALSKWLTETADRLKIEAPALKGAVGAGRFSGCKSYVLNANIDFDSLTREDLKALQPALERLYAVCKEENIAVELARELNDLPAGPKPPRI